MAHHRIAGLATCAALATTPLLAASAASPDEAVPLFDGVSLQGWSGDDRFWSVEDGAIVGRSTAQTPCERNTYLIRDGEFDDFELRLEFAIDGGNSGIQYRSRDLGDFVVAGYQADLEAGPNYTGILYEEKGRGIAAWRGERVTFEADGSRTAAAELGDRAALQAAIRPGWNEYVIRAVGPKLSHTINGVPMVEVVDLAPQAAARGRIALQLHAGPPMTVRYRDISLTPLDAGEPDVVGDPDAAPTPPPLEPSLEADDVAWIWGSDPAGENDRFFMRTRFELEEPAAIEELIATCDNRFRLSLDGEEIVTGWNWERLQIRRNLGTLQPGVHEFLARGENAGGPAGLLLRATLRFADGSSRIVRSDGSWECAPAIPASDDPNGFETPTAWRPVHSFGPSRAPNGPWRDPLAPRFATPAESITVPPGYRVELVHSARVGEGSWIAMAFDDRGDLLVGREGLPIARVDLPRRAGDVVEVVDVPGSPETSMGFASAHGALYAQGRGDEGYGLFRLRDTDDDGIYDLSERLADFGGGGEHGAHAVVPAPDGSILLMNGNMSRLPGELAATSPHARWAEDVLLERIEDPRGHAVGLKAPGGHVLRTDKDATSFEIVAAGFRNAYDLAISPDGDLFTFDSDMEWDLELPWYRPTRVYHVVPGSDHGWRSGNAKWRDGTPEMLPPVVDIGMSSPVGIAFATDSDFPADDREALFIGDWTYGRILRVRLMPDGASHTASFDHFATGTPLSVTDLAFSPDGDLWFITGGRGTQTGLYRVSWDGEGDAPNAARPAPNPAGARRRAFEAMQGRPELVDLDLVWPALGDRDRFVAHAARVALEFAQIETWREATLAESDPAIALPALLALVRAGDGDDAAAAIDRLGGFDWNGLDPDAQRWWLRVHELALARHAEAIDATRRDVVRARLEPLHPCGDRGTDHVLLGLLSHLESPDAVAPALAALAALPPSEVGPGIDLAASIRFATDGWPEGGREQVFAWLGRAKTAEGGFSFRGYLERIEADLLARAPEADRERLAALAEPPPVEVPDLAALASGSGNWSMAKLEPYLPLVSTGRDFEAGRAAYAKAACASCHRFDGSGGGGVGPDLTSAGSRFSRRDLLRTILEPSADISDQYENTRVLLRSGRILIGRVVRDDDRWLELIVDPYTSQTMRIPAKDVVAREASPVSPMPMGLLSTLSIEEILDLIAYIESAGNPHDPAFSTATE